MNMLRKKDTARSQDGIAMTFLHTYQMFNMFPEDYGTLRQTHCEIEDFDSKIGVQRAIFEGGCRSLLYTVVEDRQLVEDILQIHEHPVWTNKIVEEELRWVIAPFISSCTKLLLLTQKALVDIHKELQRLLREKEHQGRPWRNLFRRRSLPKPMEKHLLTFLERLRDSNDAIRTLIDQATRSKDTTMSYLRCPFAEDRGFSYNPKATSIHTLRSFQEAARDFCDTLYQTWSCQNASSHSISICLDFDETLCQACPDAASIFNIAVTIMPEETFELAALSSPVRDTCESKSKLGLPYHPACPVQCKGINTLKPLDYNIRDLGLESDLCLQLQESSHRSSKRGNWTSLLGYLKALESCTYFWFYIPEHRLLGTRSYSLEEVFLKAKNLKQVIPVEDRLCMARTLAIATFYLRTTTWLSQNWSSRDILFFEHDGLNTDGMLRKRPFLKAHKKKSVTLDNLGKVAVSGIINESLFSLGLTLLELAFAAPWRDLQVCDNITKDQGVQNMNNENLTRLADTVSRHLGSRYAKVVRCCFHYSFNDGELPSFGVPEQYNQVYGDIVEELDQCLSVANGTGVNLKYSSAT